MYIKCPTLLIHSLAVWGSPQVKLSPHRWIQRFSCNLSTAHCSLKNSVLRFRKARKASHGHMAGTAMVYSKRLSTHGRPRDLENPVNLGIGRIGQMELDKIDFGKDPVAWLQIVQGRLGSPDCWRLLLQEEVMSNKKDIFRASNSIWISGQLEQGWN